MCLATSATGPGRGASAVVLTGVESIDGHEDLPGKPWNPVCSPYAGVTLLQHLMVFSFVK